MAKRKTIRLFLDQAPQRYFLLLELGVLLVTLVFLFQIMMSTINQTMDLAYAQVNDSGRLVMLFDQMNVALYQKIALLFALTFLLSAFLGLLFLERLTGPLMRIQRVLEEIGSGRIPDRDVNLRKSDFPLELAEALSSAIAYLRRKKFGL